MPEYDEKEIKQKVILERKKSLKKQEDINRNSNRRHDKSERKHEDIVHR